MGVARQTVERSLELSNQKDWQAVSELYAPDAKIILPHNNEVTLEELGNIVRSVWKRFPDWRYEIFNLVEEGLSVAYEGSEGGTSKDGESVSVPVAIFVTANAEGKIARVAGYW